MKITCQTETQFYDAIYAMLTRGATFEANASTLVITLTGGF